MITATVIPHKIFPSGLSTSYW